MICKYIFLQYRIDINFIFIIFSELYTINNKKNKHRHRQHSKSINNY